LKLQQPREKNGGNSKNGKDICQFYLTLFSPLVSHVLRERAYKTFFKLMNANVASFSVDFRRIRVFKWCS
jgi:hypothetical protein